MIYRVPPPTFSLCPVIWATVSADRAADILSHHLRRARQVIADYDLPVPAEHGRLELTVKLAVEAELLFFTAAVFEPCQEERDHFFADFLCR
jgi:hypothetical protein